MTRLRTLAALAVFLFVLVLTPAQAQAGPYLGIGEASPAHRPTP